MSRTNPTQNEQIALEIDCYCNPRGTWCVTYTGKWATWLHAFRTYPVYTAMGIAYEECERLRRLDLAKRAEKVEALISQGLIDKEEAITQLREMMSRRWWA